MEQNDTTSIREMLEGIPTEQLDEMLQEELQKEVPDENVVRMILNILKNREVDYIPEITPGIENAWNKFQRSTKELEKKRLKSKRIRGWAYKTAAVVVFTCLLLFVVPQKVDAEGFFAKLARWTDDIFEFISPSNSDSKPPEYVFETDNPGLQQVYETIVGLGITDPVVPMWLPDGYDLLEIQQSSTSRAINVSARFADGNRQIVFRVGIYSVDTSPKFYKDPSNVEMRELHGTVFYIMRNNDQMVAIWAKDNFECALTADCQEDIFNKILRSIYAREDY